MPSDPSDVNKPQKPSATFIIKEFYIAIYSRQIVF